MNKGLHDLPQLYVFPLLQQLVHEVFEVFDQLHIASSVSPLQFFPDVPILNFLATIKDNNLISVSFSDVSFAYE